MPAPAFQMVAPLSPDRMLASRDRVSTAAMFRSMSPSLYHCRNVAINALYPGSSGPYFTLPSNR
ncbi:hypothetical protein D3C75_1376540 [compost metagenome]